MYSRTKVESEEIAREFLNEKVVGFDMEWPWQDNQNPNVALQQRIGLIQIACEDRIALFHIGLHSGTSPNDLLAPSLRSIIESPDISKCGVAVLNADFSRLEKWFRLKPRGAFELSHLHNLITYGAANPSKCTTKLKRLAQQVEEHLGMPLHKGKVRTSNWSMPLNRDQILYAAADSYAGFMLYHHMNAKRISMHPTPPLPAHAETYLPEGPRLKKKPISLQLCPVDDRGQVITALEFFQPRAEASISEEASRSSPRADAKPGDDGRESFEGCEREAKETNDRPLSSPSSSEEALELVRVGRRGRHIMFARAGNVGSNVVQNPCTQHAAEHTQGKEGNSELSAAPTKVSRDDGRKETISIPTLARVGAAETTSHSGVLDEERAEVLFQRLRAHRMNLARQRKCAPFIIAHDTLLHAISRQCPRDDNELLRMRGVGKMKVDEFGQAWLAIIRDFIGEADPGKSDEGLGVSTGMARVDSSPVTSFLPASQPKTPALDVRRADSAVSVSVGSIQTPPMLLHTGLSFRMGCTGLGDGSEDVGEVGDSKLDGDPGFDGAKRPHDETWAFGDHFRSPSPSSGFKRKRDEQTEAAAEKAAKSARPGWPTRPPPPIPGNANRWRTGEQSTTLGLVPASPVMAMTKTSPLPQEFDKAGPAQSSLSRSRPPPQSPAYLAPESQASSIATPLRSVTPAKHLADVGETPRPAPQPIETGDAHIFRKKLVAFNKIVTAAVQLSPVTIDHIVARPPDTLESLLHIPGITPFANACSRANRDFLAFIIKSTPKQGSI